MAAIEVRATAGVPKAWVRMMTLKTIIEKSPACSLSARLTEDSSSSLRNIACCCHQLIVERILDAHSEV